MEVVNGERMTEWHLICLESYFIQTGALQIHYTCGFEGYLVPRGEIQLFKQMLLYFKRERLRRTKEAFIWIYRRISLYKLSIKMYHHCLMRAHRARLHLLCECVIN